MVSGDDHGQLQRADEPADELNGRQIQPQPEREQRQHGRRHAEYREHADPRAQRETQGELARRQPLLQKGEYRVDDMAPEGCEHGDEESGGTTQQDGRNGFVTTQSRQLDQDVGGHRHVAEQHDRHEPGDAR